MYPFIYSPVALIEYKDAVTWYKERSAKAAEDFVKQVKEKLDKICHSPFRYPETYNHFRETLLKKYPYSLIYSVDENKKMIIVTSVFHHKRNPKRKFIKK
ncbi:MAG: type II toxin-antitoxin system RelE/ParE family toxin [Ginsengibacter sp.]